MTTTTKKGPSKKEIKAREDRVARAYARACHGVQISIWDMKKISDVGMASIDAGDDESTLEAKIAAFVETIRKN